MREGGAIQTHTTTMGSVRLIGDSEQVSRKPWFFGSITYWLLVIRPANQWGMLTSPSGKPSFTKRHAAVDEVCLGLLSLAQVRAYPGRFPALGGHLLYLADH